jgi:hypothetical protein
MDNTSISIVITMAGKVSLKILFWHSLVPPIMSPDFKALRLRIESIDTPHTRDLKPTHTALY